MRYEEVSQKNRMFQEETDHEKENRKCAGAVSHAPCAEENVLNEDGKLDYRTLKPVLFEMPTYEYLRTGDVIGKCMSYGKEANR